VLVINNVIFAVEEYFIVLNIILTLMQIFHDLCLCWLLGSCSS